MTSGGIVEVGRSISEERPEGVSRWMASPDGRREGFKGLASSSCCLREDGGTAPRGHHPLAFCSTNLRRRQRVGSSYSYAYSSSEGAHIMKCFWCGKFNSLHTQQCGGCGRDMNWSRFFRRVLRPSVGVLLGPARTTQEKPVNRPIWR